jgi:hypothetical protein
MKEVLYQLILSKCARKRMKRQLCLQSPPFWRYSSNLYMCAWRWGMRCNRLSGLAGEHWPTIQFLHQQKFSAPSQRVLGLVCPSSWLPTWDHPSAFGHTLHLEASQLDPARLCLSPAWKSAKLVSEPINVSWVPSTCPYHVSIGCTEPSYFAGLVFFQAEDGVLGNKDGNWLLSGHTTPGTDVSAAGERMDDACRHHTILLVEVGFPLPFFSHTNLGDSIMS